MTATEHPATTSTRTTKTQAAVMCMFPGDPTLKTWRCNQVSDLDSWEFAFGTERTELTLELRTGKGVRLLVGHRLPGQGDAEGSNRGVGQ